MYRKYLKRFFDIILSLIFIIILFPLMIILSIITKISFKGKVIYSQKRVGLNNKPYDIYKFKTMKDNTKETTKVSRFIRKIGADEILQFFNVLKGDMSIVGPRPFIYKEELPIMYDDKRHSVRPGITGLSQVSGRMTLSHRRKLEIDNEYIDNLSFILDVKIILRTIIYILKTIFR